LNSRPVSTLRGLLPRGPSGDLAVRVPGDRYLGLRAKLRDADIVHTQELGYWYSMQAARLKPRLGFKLVTTVWETIPFLDAYRNVRTRAYRAIVLAQTDLFLAATERARTSLLLEGADAERIRVCPPGIATDRFSHRDVKTTAQQALIVSPGRLVWEKGHQDVLRAVALLRRGLIGNVSTDVRVKIIGTGREERRLREYARELGIADAVEFVGFIGYDEMPAIYADASCVVLASLPAWSWEEQFGMVLAEAMASGTPILASSSGAIPEVAGSAARYFSPGDWPGLARMIVELVGSKQRAAPPADALTRYSTEAAATRIASAYEAVLVTTAAGAAPAGHD
jgi:glycosyltransferase involved in cell wall biosynthesis